MGFRIRRLMLFQASYFILDEGTLFDQPDTL